MEHVNEFRINAFRGLRDLKLEELGQINLFVGNNNSGKTSVLEALSLFCNPLSWSRWYNTGLQREAITSLRSSVIDRISWLFPQYNSTENDLTEKKHLSLAAVGQVPIENISANYEVFNEFVSSPLVKTPTLLEDLSDSKNQEEEIESIKVSITIAGRYKEPLLLRDPFTANETLYFNDSIYGRRETKHQQPISFPAQLVNPSSHRTDNLTSRLWSEVVQANLKEETIRLLQYFDPAILDVDFISPSERRQLISIKHQKLNRAPLHTFGDGLRRVFTLATIIPRISNGFLLIDEIETAIHTKALEKTFSWLIKACIDNNIQLLATTHSLEALDAILEASREQADFVVYRLQQEDLQTTATRFDKAMTLRLREELGLELR